MALVDTVWTNKGNLMLQRMFKGGAAPVLLNGNATAEPELSGGDLVDAHESVDTNYARQPYVPGDAVGRTISNSAFIAFPDIGSGGSADEQAYDLLFEVQDGTPQLVAYRLLTDVDGTPAPVTAAENLPIGKGIGKCSFELPTQA